MLKRAVDIVVSIVGLIAAFPLAVLAAVAIVIDTGLPVFHLQERVGRGGRLFRGIKFRSMVADAEARCGPVQAADGDRRVTAVGRILRKTALDELPQLANVLAGDMSLVGPRALRPEEREIGEQRVRSVRDFEGFAERCSVRPGLTGIAQLVAPRDVPRGEKFAWDLWYVRHRTLCLDLRLLALSLAVTALGRWESRARKLHSVDGLRARVRR
jgi:lipopolysaccharide/colanic/teichoic acid biosynthesis glycosyltransferase